MSYIAAVSTQSEGVDEVKRIVLGSNPLLEAFGNAKVLVLLESWQWSVHPPQTTQTLRNNNSSRFGKYVQMRFSSFGVPCGGQITNFLLEKSRVSGINKGERSVSCHSVPPQLPTHDVYIFYTQFHIFYQLVVGAPAAMKTLLHLEKAQSFQYLSQSQTYSIEGVNETEALAETQAVRTRYF
jgi:myosin-1